MAITDPPKRGTPTTMLWKEGDTLTTGDQAGDLVSEALQRELPILDFAPLAGDRRPVSGFMINSHENPNGSFVFRPRISQFDELLILALGGGSAAGRIPLLDTDGSELPDGDLQLRRSGTLVAQTWTDFYINELTIRSEVNSPLEVEVSIIAKSVTEAGALDPTTAYGVIDSIIPIMHSDLAITGDDASGLPVYRFQLHWTNNIQEDGYANSKTRQHFTAGQFEADLELDVALNADTRALWTSFYQASAVMNIIGTYSPAGQDDLILEINGFISNPVPAIASKDPQIVTLSINAAYDTGASEECVIGKVV